MILMIVRISVYYSIYKAYIYIYYKEETQHFERNIFVTLL